MRMGWLQRIWGARASFYAALDRPGMRWLLARLATAAAKRESTADVAIVYRGAWLYRRESEFIPAGRRFVYKHGNEIAGAPSDLRDAVRDLWLHVYTPASDDVIVDVGAGVGKETYVFAQAVGPGGRVLAVEAHPQTFRVLSAVVRANRLSNVLLSDAAVTDQARDLYIEDRELDDRNTVGDVWSPGRLRNPVQGVPLDELVSRFGLGRIDFLKMNIEGAERAAIRGMSEAIRRTRTVCISCHDWLASGRDETFRTRALVEAFLQDNGFSLVSRDDSRGFVRDQVNAVRKT